VQDQAPRPRPSPPPRHRAIGARLGSAATAGEGSQNLLCAYLAAAVLAGLLANTLFGAWWPDGVVALAIAAWALKEGRRAWAGRSCACACVTDAVAGCDADRLTATAHGVDGRERC
jgi:hypothetical protein